jgi:hypothetical protein
VSGIVEHVQKAERQHWGDGHNWSHVVVNRRPVATVNGIHFYRAYNNASDPAPDYIVGVDSTGTVYEIGGFESSQYSDLVRLWMKSPIGQRDALNIASGYLTLVDGWEPGLLLRDEVPPVVVEAIAECHRCDVLSIRPAVNIDHGEITVSGFAFDKRSTRLEAVKVRLSEASGITVLSRIVLRDATIVRF